VGVKKVTVLNLDEYLKNNLHAPIVRYWISGVEIIPKWVEEGRELPEFLEMRDNEDCIW